MRLCENSEKVYRGRFNVFNIIDWNNQFVSSSPNASTISLHEAQLYQMYLELFLNIVLWFLLY